MEVSFELIEQFFDKESNPVFQTEVRIEGIPAGTGTGYSKKESQQNAAQMALKKIKTPEFMASIEEAKIQAITVVTEAEEKTKEEIAEQEPEVITVTESITQKELTEEHELSETI